MEFILNAHAAGEFEPDSVHVELLGTEFETDLTNSTGSRWEGFLTKLSALIIFRLKVIKIITYSSYYE